MRITATGISHPAPKLALFVLLLSSLGNAQTAVWPKGANPLA